MKLPFAMDTWYSVVRKRELPARSVEFDGAFDRELAVSEWRNTKAGEGLVLTRRSKLGLLKSVLANGGRASALATWARGLTDAADCDVSLAFPSTGGGFVLIDSNSRKAFAAGTRMLPAGRRRWKILRRALARLARFGLHERLGLNEVCVLTKCSNDESIASHSKPLYMALSSGVPGLFQTAVAQLADASGRIDSYVKLGAGADAAEKIRWEGEVLERLPDLALNRADTPALLAQGEAPGGSYIVQEALTGPRSPDELRRAHLEFLIELQQRTRSSTSLEQCEDFTVSVSRLSLLQAHADKEWLDLAHSARDVLSERLVDGLIPCCLVHGDFTPWNTILDEERLRVFDWEYARFEAPALGDLFHFIIQTEVLVIHATDVLHNGQAVRLILARIREVMEEQVNELLAPVTKNGCEWLELLLLYLFNITVRDEWLHSKERPLFEQVSWLREARMELMRVVISKLASAPRTSSLATRTLAA